jgi:hypothetical protein
MVARGRGAASTDVRVTWHNHAAQDTADLWAPEHPCFLRKETIFGPMLVGVAQCGWAFRDYDLAGPGRANARRWRACP